MSSVERNTEKWLNRTASGRRELNLMRPQEAPQPLPEALFHCVDLLQQWTGAPRVLYKGLPGKRKFPPQEIPFSVEAIAQYVIEKLSMTGLEDSHAQVFNLQDTGKIKSSYDLGWSAHAYIDSPGLHAIEARFSIDEDYSAERFRSGDFGEFFGRLASGTSATQAFIFESRTRSLYVAARRLEDALRKGLSEQANPGPITGGALPEDEQLFLPSALYDHEINLRMVPEAVWWLNYWNETIVENIGRERILAAPWAALREMPEGALLLEATREPLDVARRDHCQKLREIFEAIDLRGVQERFRLQRI